jgi:hypothetical protein
MRYFARSLGDATKFASEYCGASRISIIRERELMYRLCVMVGLRDMHKMPCCRDELHSRILIDETASRILDIQTYAYCKYHAPVTPIMLELAATESVNPVETNRQIQQILSEFSGIPCFEYVSRCIRDSHKEILDDAPVSGWQMK